MPTKESEYGGYEDRPQRKPFRSEGARRITAERQRHFDGEGWTIQGDVENHTKGELLRAAVFYISKGLLEYSSVYIVNAADHLKDPWPPSWDKRAKHSTIRCLEIAGSLIAAEIDRRLALGEEE